MGQGRTTAQRQTDVRAVLEKNGHAWLATASADGKPRLIAVSFWWDGSQIVVATTAGSRTARNLESSQLGRLAIGTPDDVIMIDATLAESTPVADAKPDFRAGFVRAVGWDPAEEGPDWKLFRLRPVQIQAYRGYAEQPGREVMLDSRWLA